MVTIKRELGVGGGEIMAAESWRQIATRPLLTTTTIIVATATHITTINATLLTVQSAPQFAETQSRVRRQVVVLRGRRLNAPLDHRRYRRWNRPE